MTVVPAYGRDYQSAEAATAAWSSGTDFILMDRESPWYGKPISQRDVDPGTEVRIRYARLRRVVTVGA